MNTSNLNKIYDNMSNLIPTNPPNIEYLTSLLLEVELFIDEINEELNTSNKLYQDTQDISWLPVISDLNDMLNRQKLSVTKLNAIIFSNNVKC